MAHNKKRIAVLMGGNSHEKEISLESGRNVVYKLSSLEYKIIPIFISLSLELYNIPYSLLVKSSTKDIELHLDKVNKISWQSLSEISDFVFLALHGGVGENGSVQGFLEMMNIPYNGSGVFASSLCMNKYRTAQFLKLYNFEVPQQKLISYKDWKTKKKEITALFLKTFTFPFIIKPHNDGCTFMVFKIMNENQLSKKMDKLFDQGKRYVLAEEYVQGMELTVGVIGNQDPKVFLPTKTVSSQDVLSVKEKFLPGEGENITPAPLAQDTISFIQETIKKVFQEVGCSGYARIDCFYQTAEESLTRKERLIILEINSLPGLTPATCIFHQAAEEGMRPVDFLNNIINLGLQKHRERIKNSNSLEIEEKEDSCSV